MVKNLPAMWGTRVLSLGQEDPLEKGMGAHSSGFLPGESPWTEEPGRLQSTGSQRVGHNLVTKPPPPCIMSLLLPVGHFVKLSNSFL